MFAGTESGCRVEHDPDRAAWHTTAMVRPMDKEPADSQWREGELVLCQPVASRQLLLADLGERASRRGGAEREARRESRGQHR
jgi:hypothetical protein